MSDFAAYVKALRGPILVTGAAGFIGANLFRKLAAHRDDVVAVQRDANGWRLDGSRRDALITADLTDPAATKNLLDSVAPQTIFDCAAYGAYSFEADTERMYATNLLALVRMTRMLSERRVAAYVHAGSSSEYGTNGAAPPEDARSFPNSHYALSKIAAANHLRYLGKQLGFPCVNLRLYAVYGPLEDSSRLIPRILRCALSGSFPPLVDAHVARDFVHVDDVCAAFVLAAVKMNPSLYGEDVNIGTGVQTTIGSLAEIVKRRYEVQGDPTFGSMPQKAWDLAQWYADPAKAERILGWRAAIALPDGLDSTMQWVRALDDASFEAANKSLRKKKRSVSAVVACYKDAQAIPSMYERLSAVLSRLGVDYELIFVDDGSPDDGASIVRALSAKDPRIIGISHSRNFGSQMAFRSGMEVATKECVVLLDGDLQDPPELIEPMYARWDEGYDVVYGRRVRRDMPRWREWPHKMFYRIFAAFSYIPIPLDAGDFSLIDRRAVGWILACGERDLFVRGLRAYVGFKQAGVDYVRPERPFGRSTNSLRSNIEWAKRGIFSFSNAPLTMLTTGGVAAFAVSMLAAAVEATLRIFFPAIAPRGITTVVIAILFFGSINLFAIGLVGEYVAKIMTEVKGRPRLIRSAFVRNGEVRELPVKSNER